MRKVERWEIPDGRIYEDPLEALNAETISSIASLIPCTEDKAIQIISKWGMLKGLVDAHAEAREALETKQSA